MQGQKCFNDKRLLFFIGTQCQRPSGGKMDPNSTKVVRNRSQGNLIFLLFSRYFVQEIQSPLLLDYIFLYLLQIVIFIVKNRKLL